MVDFVINNNIVSPRTITTSNFDSVLTLIRSQIESVSSDLLDILTQNIPSSSITNTAGGINIQLPQLADIIAGQSSIILNTTTPIIGDTDLNLVIQNTNIALNPAGIPVLQVTGLINQPLDETGATTQQPFTSEIPLPTNATNATTATNAVTATTDNTTTASQILNTTDTVTTTAQPNNQIIATTNNLNENITTVLPQNLQNIDFNVQNSLNIQVVALAPPEVDETFIEEGLPDTVQAVSPTVDLDIENNQSRAQQLFPQEISTAALTTDEQIPQISLPAVNVSRVITGTVEVNPNSNEAVIHTTYGDFRISNISNIPNGSTISFTIEGEVPLDTEATNNILSLNPTNIQTLKLALESADSPISNLLKMLNNNQALSTLVQRFFPNPDDKNSYSRQLMFASAAAKGSAASWLSGDEQNAQSIAKTLDGDANFNRLQDVFTVMKNFTGHDAPATNTNWNSYIIPFYDGSKLTYMTVQTQRDPEGENQQNTKGKKKFVLELEQDDLGRVAIEGLYSKTDAKVNDLDLIIKTDNEISDQFKNELEQAYKATASAYGFSGTLTFSQFNGSAMPVYADISKILGDGIVI